MKEKNLLPGLNARTILLSFLFTLAAGCNTMSIGALGEGKDAGGQPIYMSGEADQKQRLEKFLTEHSGVVDEETKIQFLLESMDTSPYRFIRNGASYTGNEAMQWLRWKKGHPQYRNNPIVTAEDFVNRVANGSKATGRPYAVVVSDGKAHDTKFILQNELDSLEAALKARQPAAPLAEAAPDSSQAAAPVT